MIDPLVFQIILLLIGILSTAVIAYLFTSVWKPKPEKIFEDNMEKITQMIFQQLSLIDVSKQRIFNYLDNAVTFDMQKQSWHTFPEPIFNDMKELQNMIRGYVDSLTEFLRLSGYITLNQYLAVQSYAISAYSFFNTITNMKFTIIIDKKTLEFHRYRAKQIIQFFGKSTPEIFLNKWNFEFVKNGGIDSITEPRFELGNVIGPYHNLFNQLLLYDPNFYQISIKLDQIQKTLDNLTKK